MDHMSARHDENLSSGAERRRSFLFDLQNEEGRNIAFIQDPVSKRTNELDVLGTRGTEDVKIVSHEMRAHANRLSFRKLHSEQP